MLLNVRNQVRSIPVLIREWIQGSDFNEIDYINNTIVISLAKESLN